MASSEASRASRRPTLYLHIGAPKTGTSYLQQVIWRNRARLAEDGVLRPGGREGDHFGAAMDLGVPLPQLRARMHRPGGWRSMTAQVRSWQGISVISAENLASADAARIARASASLESVETHIVYTARDLARQIPSVWQERLKNREAVSYRDYVGGVISPDGGHPIGAKFWHAQDIVAVLERWSADIPPERVHVITVPQSGAPGDILWTRFASVLGIDPTRYEASVPRANTSLGAAEAQVLLRLNQALGKRFSKRDYGNLVKGLLAKEVLAARADSIKIGLMEEYAPWALERSEQLVQAVRTAGYQVVGDLDELLPLPTGSPAVHPDEVEPDAVLQASIGGLAGVLERFAAATHNPPRRPRSKALTRHLAGGPAKRGVRSARKGKGTKKSRWSRILG